MKQLAKYHNPLALAWSGTNWEFNNLPGYNGGWELRFGNADPSNIVALSETYFDMAGMALDDKTIMTDAIAVQEAYFPTLSQLPGGGSGDQVWIYDLITSIPITSDTDWAKVYLGGAGFPSLGVLNFEHVLYQRVRRFTVDIDYAGSIAVKTGDEQSGSLAPTASDRLYSYRLVIAYNITGNLIGTSTPAGRHLIAANVKEEPQYEYLMRLMRSYQLQQEPDVD